MLEGCVPWPEPLAQRYRALGYWNGSTIYGVLQAAARTRPRHVALVAGAQRITYAQLDATVERLACGFLRAGLRPLDRVVVQLPNIPAFVQTYFALARIGSIPVMALRAHRHTEVRHFLGASGAVAYVIPDRIKDFDYRAMAKELTAACPALRSVFVVGEPAPDQQAWAGLLNASMSDAEVRSALTGVAPAAEEVATMLLSGGTTSLSKLIPRTNDDYVLNARLCGAAAGFDEHNVLMAILPLGHNYNLASPGMLGTFHFGGTVVLASSADAEEVFRTVEAERVTAIAAAVPLISGWLDSQAPNRYDLSSLKVVQNGGARLAPELRARLRERFHCTPQEIYGTAEGLINMTRLDDPDPLLLESSGTPVCDEDEIEVVDDEGREVADGAQGELLTRGPYTIHGYYDAADKNREAFTADGFYRMGDIVRKHGRYVYTEGRRKDIINRGGEKISCDEVENLIYAHPKVKAVTLVAMPDPAFGEKACAFVVCKPGEALGFRELIDFLKARRIAAFKLPERLELLPELPTSPVGKILKRELRDAITRKLQDEGRARPGA
jgi:2,3-dihydroxybenzoate---[aryl-carrier protein] ligase